ncbi:LysR substrate-binding domain-containing protein, partial [Intrasporangium calvum]
AALRNGDCDVAVAFAYEGADLGVLEEDLSLLETHHLLDDEVRVVVPKSNPLADRASVSLSDFADEEWIAGCPRCRGHLVSLADHEGFRPNVAFEIEDYVAQIGLVTAGLGVALVPDLILNAAKHEEVATLSLSPVSRRQILAVTTSDLQRVPAVAAALRALGEAAGAEVDVPEPALSPA